MVPEDKGGVNVREALEQVEDMERELDFKERRITEMEAELKLLRNERE